MSTHSQNLVDDQGWDHYWKISNRNRVLYNIIAEFYRRFIIRPNLNRFVKKYFTKNSRILHAGCGSGQVDKDIRHHVNIIGLDISLNALSIYKRENGPSAETIHGSIFAIPLDSNSVDGVYNLGVMEHFSHEDIQKILNEFHRVLKPNGRIILFWPPEFGLSVIFFKVLKTSLEFIFRREFKFHPDEISRLNSKSEAKTILKQARFKSIRYSFGPRDLFTYSIVVAEKSP